MDLDDFQEFEFTHLLSAPTPERGADEETGALQFLPPIVSAHANRQRIILGWINPGPNVAAQGLIVVAGADGGRRSFPFVGHGEGEESSCLFPPGGRGRRLDPLEFLGALKGLPSWAALPAEPATPDRQQRMMDGSEKNTASPPHRGRQIGFEDVAIHLYDTPFAWFLLAEPTGPEDSQSRFQEVQSAARSLATAGKQPGEQALDLSVATSLLDHLHRGRFVGLWTVRWLVGSVNGAAVGELAELLAATCALQHHPLLPVPSPDVASIEDTLNRSGPVASWEEARVPFITTSDHLAALGRTPGREVPGFRTTLPQSFDTNSERVLEDGGGADHHSVNVSLGSVLDEWRRPSGDFKLSSGALNRHVFVCGATGSGKSQTVRHLLEELSHHGVPWLVIEPAKAEYRRMSDRLKAAGVPVHVVRLGAPDQPPCMINPLEPEPGFNLQTHVDMVTALFLAAFEADEPFPQVLAESLRRCYEDLGWDLATGMFNSEPVPPQAAAESERSPSPSYPTLAALQATADDVVRGIGYGPEVQSNVRGFIKVRLNSLRLGTPGRFFESGHPLDIAKLLSSNVVFELENVGSDQDKAFVIGAVLTRLVEHLRVHRSKADSLEHVTVIEEAHRLLRRPDRSGPASHAIETFAALLAEVRAYGEGLVIAEQIPTKIIPDVVKNTAVQIMHRLPARDDRELIGAAMNMDPEQMGYVVGLGRGEAAAFAEGMDRPLLVKVKLGTDREGDGKDARDSTDLLLGRRSPLCPSLCWERPCTILDMRSGLLWASSVRGLDLYVEFVMLNLLRRDGPGPLPVQSMVAAVSVAGEERMVECGLGQLVQTTVGRRRAVLSEYCDPAEVLETMTTFVREALGLVPRDPAGTSSWSRSVDRFRLPDALEPVKVQTYLGQHADALAPSESPHGVGLLPQLAAEFESQAEGGLEARVSEIVERHELGPTALDCVEDLASILAWCFEPHSVQT